MDECKLARHISKAITNGSKTYFAHVSKIPRIYVSLAGDRLVHHLCHGIIIESYYDVHWIRSRTFIFMPAISSYIKSLSKTDCEFAKRAQSMSLFPDDLERMVYELSLHEIKLWMRGRKSFDYE